MTTSRIILVYTSCNIKYKGMPGVLAGGIWPGEKAPALLAAS